jgi:hypothetical protein
LAVKGNKVSHRDRRIVVTICLAVAALHFVIGPQYAGPLQEFVSGYLIDILLPFAMFLLLGIQNLDRLHGKFTRLILVFGVGAAAETMQYFGMDILGHTFDPLDYAMYLAGIVLAVIFERLVLSRSPRGSASVR